MKHENGCFAKHYCSVKHHCPFDMGIENLVVGLDEVEEDGEAPKTARPERKLIQASGWSYERDLQDG